MGNKIDFNTRYGKLGLTIFLTGAALILCIFAVFNMSQVKAVIDEINDILFPFYLGIVMAYLLCPIYNGAMKHAYKWGTNMLLKPTMAYTLARFMASFVAVVFLSFVVGSLIMLVIPDLIASIISLIKGIPEMADGISLWVQEHIEQNPDLVLLLQGKIEETTNGFFDWAQANIIPGAESLLEGVSVGVLGTFGIAVDLLVALVICVYVLNSKEIFQAQAKKFILAVFSPKKAEEIFEFGKICNHTFGGFINGKIIDSIIIGILCFIAMTFLKLPLALLISVVVGVTNIIPFFGPFIGAIPSTILLLCIDPVAALKFAVMVLALQQLDGNVIGPKILGKATKLASFWVMFAILVGGGLFGFVGMILGVPTMAVIYVYFSKYINGKLVEKDLPSDTEIYECFDKYKIDKEDIFGKDVNNYDIEIQGDSSATE